MTLFLQHLTPHIGTFTKRHKPTHDPSFAKEPIFLTFERNVENNLKQEVINQKSFPSIDTLCQ